MVERENGYFNFFILLQFQKTDAHFGAKEVNQPVEKSLKTPNVEKSIKKNLT
jgi:hypothetical protein